MTDQIQAFIQGLGNAMSQIETAEAERKCPKPKITETDPTKQAIIDMMTESTGCHILDSGGVYGRSWQRNRQIKDWDTLPELDVEAYCDDWYCTVSTYHFLKAYLEVTEESKRLQKQFEEFSNTEEYKKEPWLVCMEEFVRNVLGIEYVRATNTYNFDNVLDNDIQFIMTYWDNPSRKIELEAPIIILQTHNGCDIRGGYPKPRIFTLEEPDQFMLAMTDLDVQCEKCGMRWYSDDSGCNWYYGGCSSNMKPVDGERDEEFKNYVDEEEKVRHKGCGGQLSFFPHLFY